VSGSSIFYHTHYLYLIHHFEKPRFYNEFANWASQALQEERLAERLAAIDLLSITSIRDLGEAIVSVIQKHLKSGAARRDSPAGDEFHFCEASLERPTNDFSQWLADLGETRLALAIDKLNPYVMTLEELKAEIIKLRRRRTRR
jgi:hypothetical protein